MRHRALLTPLLLAPAAALVACVPPPELPVPSGPAVPTTSSPSPGDPAPTGSTEPSGSAAQPTSSAPRPVESTPAQAPTSSAPASAPAAAPADGCATDPDDSLLPGEGDAWGVPLDWNADDPRNSFVETGLVGDELHAWGALDEDAAADPESVGYVELRDMVLQVTYDDGTTEVIQADPDPTGAAYVPDFADDANVDVEEVDGPEGVVVPVGGGYNYHFWPEVGPQSVDVDRLRSVQASYQARLAPDRAYGSDPVLMQVGVDNWQDSVAGSGDPQPQIGQSRKRYVTDEWSCITFTTDPQA